MKTPINTPNAPAAIGPYSQAIKIGNLIFCSGQIALNPRTGELVQESIEAETTQVLENIKAILAEVEADFSNVVKASIFLSDMNNFAAVNTVYASYFKEPYPARETVEVSRLPKDVNVEISVIASMV